MNEQLRTRLEQLEDIPSLSTAVARLFEALDDESATAATVSDIIQTDPGLASRTLKIANSAFYGFGSEIASLQDAVVCLGFNTVRQLALGATVIQSFQDQEDDSIQGKLLWLHIFHCATCARIVGKAMKMPDADELLAIGLIHDVGLMTFYHFMPDDYVSALALEKKLQTTPRAAEERVFGGDHTEAGAWLCEQWGLPPIFGLAALHHHGLPAGFEDSEENMKKLSVIYLANWIASKIDLEYGYAQDVPDPDTNMLGRIRLPSKPLNNIAEQIKTQTQSLMSLLDAK